MITNKKKFSMGIFLMLTFIGVFCVIFMPIFGEGKNGLEFSDDLFNKLAKGSSYFIPEVQKEIKATEGKQVTVAVKFKDASMAKTVDTLLAKVGGAGELKGDSYEVKADLHQMLAQAVADADLMYKDNGKPIADMYGMDEKKVVKGWYTLFNAMIQPLQRQKMIDEANVINTVNQKALEPAYNFYGIPAENILSKIPTVSALLVFYVLYTMWYGFAIFDLFNGMGLSMSKSKIKKEV